MKTRLVWLGLLCCAFLFAMSLMVADAAPVEVIEEDYIQSMALPAPSMALADYEPEPKFPSNKTVPLHGYLADEASAMAQEIAPEQFLSYHVLAYYAFHYSDEAG